MKHIISRRFIFIKNKSNFVFFPCLIFKQRIVTFIIKFKNQEVKGYEKKTFWRKD